MNNSHQTTNFSTSKKFFDDVNFPRGFYKSGDFTKQQAELLETYGHTLKALHEGTATPTTDDEVQFAAFCRDQLPATSAIEKAWEKYLLCLSKRNIYFTASSAAVSDNEFTEDDI